jgi:hypothetical protein
VAGALLNNRAQTGVWVLAPLASYEQVAFALQVADEDDIEGVDDPVVSDFLRRALPLRRQMVVKFNVAHLPPDELTLNLNLYQVAIPVVIQMWAKDPPPCAAEDGFAAQYAFNRDTFQRVSKAVLARHPGRYGRVVAQSFLDKATDRHTRLKTARLPFLALAGLALLCCLLGRDRTALAGATCVLAHFASLAVVCLHEEPIHRYIYFSEWVCLLGFFLAALAALGAVGRLAGRLARAGVGQPPAPPQALAA